MSKFKSPAKIYSQCHTCHDKVQQV